MLVYLGTAMTMVGICIMFFTSIDGGTNILTGLGGFAASMGLVASFVGLKDGKKIPARQSHLVSIPEVSNRQEESANKAFGFVMIALGVFVLGVSWFVAWPLTLIGATLLIGGTYSYLRS